jgi:hypothetical protein
LGAGDHGGAHTQNEDRCPRRPVWTAAGQEERAKASIARRQNDVGFLKTGQQQKRRKSQSSRAASVARN